MTFVHRKYCNVCRQETPFTNNTCLVCGSNEMVNTTMQSDIDLKKIKNKITHDDLVKYGRKWLSSKSPVVISEISSGAGEEPDVIAFNTSHKIGYGTVLLECKTTRQDFKNEKKKYSRNIPELGLGNYRYYLTPKGLLKIEELPEKWGLLEASPRGRISIIRKAIRQDSNKNKEVLILISLLRRLKIEPGEHVSLKTYIYETKNKTTLTVNRYYKS